jgi:hypothetical protein
VVAAGAVLTGAAFTATDLVVLVLVGRDKLLKPWKWWA